MGTAQTKECKEKFQEMCNGDVTGVEREFWRPIFLSGCSLPELHEVMRSDNIRFMRARYPQNLASLLVMCLEQLQHFVSMSTNGREVPFKSASTSLRIITRVMPVLFEELQPDTSRPAREQTGIHFVEKFFWENSKLLPSDPDAPYTTFADAPLEKPFGMLLMDTLLDLTLTPTGCVNPTKIEEKPEYAQSHPEILVNSLWYGGVGPVSSENIPSYGSLDSNRLDVVRCIVACATGTMFQANPLNRDRFVDVFVRSERKKDITTFVFSLLNCIAPYDPSGSLPYTSYMTDDREPLMTSALHLMLIMLDNGYLCVGDTAHVPRKGYAATAQVSPNVFWKTLSTLDRPEDLQKIYDFATKLLSNPMEAKQTWLPGSQKALENTPEVLGLLWKILDSNEGFRKFICKETHVAKLVTPLMYHMWQAKISRESTMTMQVALWIMLLLSSERDFTVALNEPMQSAINLPLPAFTGSYIDLVFIVFQQLIQSGAEWVRLSTDGLLTVLANLSPYAKSTCSVTAAKLLSLYDGLSSARFINSSQENWRCLFLLLQVFNNLVQYQYEGNLSLVYAILRKEASFRGLAEKLEAGEGAPYNIGAEGRQSLQSHLKTVTLMIGVLYPEIRAFCEASDTVEEKEMMEFLSKSTLVGLLPQPHSILIRTYFATPQIYSYISTWVWGLIYNRYHTPPMFAAEYVRLFPIMTESYDGKVTTVGAQRPAAPAPSNAAPGGVAGGPAAVSPKLGSVAAEAKAAPVPTAAPVVHVPVVEPAVPVIAEAQAPAPVAAQAPVSAGGAVAAPPPPPPLPAPTDKTVSQLIEELEELRQARSQVDRLIHERMCTVQAAWTQFEQTKDRQGGIVL